MIPIQQIPHPYIPYDLIVCIPHHFTCHWLYSSSITLLIGDQSLHFQLPTSSPPSLSITDGQTSPQEGNGVEGSHYDTAVDSLVSDLELEV